MAMSHANPKVDQEHIRHRIQDWQDRLDRLYHKVSNWLDDRNDLSIDTDSSVLMNEELMREQKVDPVTLPVLTISRGKETLLQFRPIGLWVIGANGRVDVFSKKRNWILVDLSDRFSMDSDWKMATPSSKKALTGFDKQALIDMLQ